MVSRPPLRPGNMGWSRKRELNIISSIRGVAMETGAVDVLRLIEGLK